MHRAAQVSVGVVLLLLGTLMRSTAGQCVDPGAPLNGGRTPAPSADQHYPLHDESAAAPPPSRYAPGDEIYYYCNAQFSLGNGSRACAVCGLDGQWMPDQSAAPPPRCVANRSAVPEITCGPTTCERLVPDRRNAKCNLATGVATRTDIAAHYPHANLVMEIFPGSAPWLDMADTHTDGLAFIGIPLTRNHAASQRMLSHNSSITRQKQFDFNRAIDRGYQYFGGTSDDGWLVAGGESGASFKLPNRDSAHIELMRVGSFNAEWGGVPIEEIVAALSNGSILIPHMGLTPSYVNARGFGADTMPPPEVELRFNLEPPRDLDTAAVDTWPNWALMFVREYNQFSLRPVHSCIAARTHVLIV
jgi:hypothetical protein